MAKIITKADTMEQKIKYKNLFNTKGNLIIQGTFLINNNFYNIIVSQQYFLSIL